MTPLQKKPIPILMYHEVTPAEQVAAMCHRMRSPHCVSIEQLEAQMRFLKENHFVSLSLTDLLERPFSEKSVGEKAGIVITFDDGYAGNFRHALPVLERYGFRATFFLVTEWIGREGMLGWDEVREMARRGMEIGSHTATHPLLSTIPCEAILEELSASRQILEQQTGTPITSLALPGGDIPKDLERTARLSGYRAVATSQIGYVEEKSLPFCLPRIPIDRGCLPTTFARIVSGDPIYLARLKIARSLRMALKHLIGTDRYRRIYERISYRLH